jgi:hypothetical protein
MAKIFAVELRKFRAITLTCLRLMTGSVLKSYPSLVAISSPSMTKLRTFGA